MRKYIVATTVKQAMDLEVRFTNKANALSFAKERAAVINRSVHVWKQSEERSGKDGDGSFVLYFERIATFGKDGKRKESP